MPAQMNNSVKLIAHRTLLTHGKYDKSKCVCTHDKYEVHMYMSFLTKFIKSFCDNVLAISKSSFDVSFKVEINLYLKDCLGNSCYIFGNSLLGFLKL